MSANLKKREFFDIPQWKYILLERTEAETLRSKDIRHIKQWRKQRAWKQLDIPNNREINGKWLKYGIKV